MKSRSEATRRKRPTVGVIPPGPEVPSCSSKRVPREAARPATAPRAWGGSVGLAIAATRRIEWVCNGATTGLRVHQLPHEAISFCLINLAPWVTRKWL